MLRNHPGGSEDGAEKKFLKSPLHGQCKPVLGSPFPDLSGHLIFSQIRLLPAPPGHNLSHGHHDSFFGSSELFFALHLSGGILTGPVLIH